MDLVEALALVHDVAIRLSGTPARKRWTLLMREHGLFFDHNLHALRIVEDFELRYAAFRGLNLTFEVREGIIKHSHDYSVEQFPELAEYLLDQRPPLEAQLIDLADEIAYNTADIDDGYEARLLTFRRSATVCRCSMVFIARPSAPIPMRMEKLKFNEALKRILDRLVRRSDRKYAAPDCRRPASATWRKSRDARSGWPPSVRRWKRSAAKQRVSVPERYISAALEPEKNDAERMIRELFDILDGETRGAAAELSGESASRNRCRVWFATTSRA